MTASPDVVAAAVAQVEQGFAAFALRANAKVPVTEHGFKNATRKPDWIATQLKAPPAGNYGIVWPEDGDERVVAFDLDNGSDGRETPWQDRLRARIEALGPLPATKHTITPSGGRHAFYRWPADVPIPSGDELFGFTVRWPGRGYLVGPGSSINGVAYQAGPHVAIADLPEAWVQAAIAEHPATRRRTTDGLITIAAGYTLPDAIPAGRRYAAVRDYVASRYNAGLGPDELWTLVLSQVAPRFSVAKTEAELRADFDRVVAKIDERLGPPRARGSAPVAPRTPEEISASSIDAAALLELDIPPLEWIIPELIPEGTTVLAGPPKLGKSCLVYQIAVEVAVGGELFDRDVDQGDVLYLALEDGKRRGQMRLRGALAGRLMPPGRLEVRWSAARIGEGLEEELIEWLDAHPNARLVAVDTLQRVRGRADARRNAYEVDVEDLGRLQNIFRDRAVALLIVHHSKKDAGDDFLASVSGTYGITGSVDTTLVIQRKRLESFGKLVATGRDIAEVELSVQFLDQLWQPAPEDVTEGTFERARIYRVIQDAPGPLMPAEIARETGLEPTSVSHMLAKMRRAGSVARTTGGWVVAGVAVRLDAVTGVIDTPENGSTDHSDHSDDPSRGRARGVDHSDHSDHSPKADSVPGSDQSDRGHTPTRARARPADAAPTLTVVRDDEPVVPVAAWCHYPAEHSFRHRDVLTDSPWCEICSPREESV